MCFQDPDVFCNLCREFEVRKLRRKMTAEVEIMDFVCFEKEADAEKSWIPQSVSNTCEIIVKLWRKEKNKNFFNAEFTNCMCFYVSERFNTQLHE